MKELSTHFIQRNSPEPASYIDVQSAVLDQDGPGLRDYWRVVRRHSRMIASLVGGALLVTGLVVITMIPTYTAKSTILVEPQAPRVLDMREVMADGSVGDEHDYFKTQEEILRSRSLAAQVIRELGLENNPLFSDHAPKTGFFGGVREKIGSITSDMLSADSSRGQTDPLGVDPQAIDQYLNRLTVKPEIGTRLFTIEFGVPDPNLAARITNAHVQSYIRRGMEIHAQASEDARQFLEKKLVDLKERVEKSEAALNSYRRDRGIVAFALDDKENVLNQRLSELNQALTKAETERIDLESQDSMIHKRDYDSLPAVINSTLIQNLKGQLDVSAGQYASMASQFKPDYPPLAELKAKLDESNNHLRREIQYVVAGIESNYETAVAREEGLRKQLETEKTSAMALNDASLQDAVLAREVDANSQLYKSVLERMKEIGVAGEIPTSNVSIIDHAAPPRQPSSPRKFIDLSLAGALSLFFGVSLAFLLDYLDDGLRNPEEAEIYLGLPSLGSVPDFISFANEQSDAPAAITAQSAPSLITDD
ncbi:MAG TPA: GumC family protein, partial [Candidatus Binataceae bacterium]